MTHTMLTDRAGDASRGAMRCMALLALLIGSASAAIAGVVTGIASLRVREDFLAIVTMGVGFLFIGVVRKAPWFGAEMGISKIPAAPFKPQCLLPQSHNTQPSPSRATMEQECHNYPQLVVLVAV